MATFEWNGRSLFFRERGRGFPMLILPGNTSASFAHQGEMAYFEERYRTISLDFLGTGGSERVSEWTPEYWEQGAYQARALLDHLGLEQCIVMGTSGGAVVALIMAIRFPDFVRAVIADSCVERIDPFSVKEYLIKDRSRRTDDQVRFWKHCHGDDWEQVVDADTTMIAQFAAGGGDWFQGRLNRVRCPVLITAGRTDAVLPSAAQHAVAMAAQIPDCYVYIHRSGDHPLMWSEAYDFRCLANCFLAKVEH